MNRSTKLLVIGLTLLVFTLTACGQSATSTPLPAATFTSVPNLEPTAQPPVSAPTDASAPAASTVSFAKDVLPILQSRCFNCHGGQDTRAGLSVASYEALMAGSQHGAVIIPGDPANSLLIQLIQQGKMPKRGTKITADQLQILIDWIQAGALNN
jgi:uncharacterized membrane protein